jgi:hypothetical protein
VHVPHHENDNKQLLIVIFGHLLRIMKTIDKQLLIVVFGCMLRIMKMMTSSYSSSSLGELGSSSSFALAKTI